MGSDQRRNIAVDVLRVASIFYIVGFWHLMGYSESGAWANNEVTERLVVTCLATFVFISGLLLGAKKPSSLIGFYASRFWRIYVPFIFATLLFMAVHYGDKVTLLKGLFLWGMLDEPAAPTLWFANMIVLFYLLAPFLIQLKDRIGWYAATCALILGTLFAWNHVSGSLDSRLMLYFLCFAVGIALPNDQPLKNPKIAVGLVLAAGVSLILTRKLPMGAIQFNPRLIPWALFSSAGILSCLSILGRGWNQNLVLGFLSTASFFMYLLHRPIYKLLLEILPVQRGARVIWELLLIGLPLVVVLSWALQKLYDRLVARLPRGLVGK